MTQSVTPSKTTTDRIIQKVKAVGFRSFIEWADLDDCHQNPVFIASFSHPSLGTVDAFCKLYQMEGAYRGLVNEITGYLFGHALNVPQPENAFVANIPLKNLRSLESRYPPEHWLMQLDRNKDWPAFCTTRLDGKSAAVHLGRTEISSVVEDVAGWIDLPRAVALDENIAHADRHLNNLIRLGRKKYAVIDNGRLVNENGEWWTKDMLAPHQLYRNRLSERVWKHAPDNDTIGKLIDFSAHHDAAFCKIADELLYWLKLLAPQDCAEFERFLKSRSTELEWLIKRRYNRLI